MDKAKRKMKLDPLPTFSIGISEKENEEVHTEESVDKKDKAKKTKKDYHADTRLRHKMSIPKVYELMQSINSKQRKKEILKLLNDYGFGGMVHICNWTKIHSFFVDWVTKNFDKENLCISLTNDEVLELKEEDVHRVYELPTAEKKINLNLCSEGAIMRLREELELKGSYSTVVKVTELDDRLSKIQEPKVWVKGAILMIIHNMLCPTNHSTVSLQYAHVLEDRAGVYSYNWCSYMLEYMREGIQGPEVANPLADFHFLMINYMEKMGKQSSFLTGKYKRPSLREWDVKLANQKLQKIHEIMGLEHGLTIGVTKRKSKDEGPTVLWFDADTCPLFTTEMHAQHCRDRIKIYTRSLETLERRLAEEKISKKAKVDESEKVKPEEKRKTESPKTEVKRKIKRIDERNVQTEEKTDGSSIKKTPKKKESSTKQQRSVGEEKKETMKKKTRSSKRLNKENAEEEEKGNRKSEKMKEKEEQKFQFPLLKGPNDVSDSELNYDKGVEDEFDEKEIDDMVNKACNVGLSFTQEAIIKYPEYFGPEINSSLNATPIKCLPPDTDVIDVEDNKSESKKKGRKNKNMCDGIYAQGRRLVKKSKYLTSPYDDNVYESNTSKVQKDIATYAWSYELDKMKILYYAINNANAFQLQRSDLMTLAKDEWVSSFVINCWVNCLNWKQPNDNITRLITPMLNYFDMKGLDMEDNRTPN